jgi:hypothetical protein
VNISTLRQFLKIPFCIVSGYITAVHDSEWWLRYVMERTKETEVHFQLLHTRGTAAVFMYHIQLDEVIFLVNHILSLHTLHLKLEELTNRPWQKAVMCLKLMDQVFQHSDISIHFLLYNQSLCHCSL